LKNKLNSKSTLKNTTTETKASLTKVVKVVRVVVAEDKRQKLFTKQSSLTIEVEKEAARQT
jgi:hypothetical protein